MKRRSFLHKLSHAAAAPIVLPSILQSALAQHKGSFLSNTNEPGRILVLIKLDGGNDGLNTVIPLNQLSELNEARSHVMLPDESIINLDSHSLGLHPELAGFKSLFDEQRLKIIQNVGYEQPDFSHFRSMDIWQSGSDYDEFLNSGWIGRYIEGDHPNWPTNYPNENYPDPLSIELGGGGSSILFTGNQSFTSYLTTNPDGFHEDILFDPNANYPDDNVGVKLRYIDLVKYQSNEYTSTVKNAYEQSELTHEYEESDFGEQFDIMTRLILGGLNTRIYMVTLGGFDTHDTQVDPLDNTKGEHAYLLKELNDKVLTFFQNLDEVGKSDDVLCMTFSEFGRTIVSNGSRGTDHGTAAPLFIFGNRINPEILGENPVIPRGVRWEDNLTPEYDYRSIYATVIDQWLTPNDSKSETILGRKFDQFELLRSDNYAERWILFPNPVNDVITIGVPKSISSFHYQIYDLNGRLHNKGNAFVNPSKVYRISADHLQKGYYLASIRHQNGNEVLKFYKQ
jgi:uncharacterized protein (DUF1501 family)